MSTTHTTYVLNVQWYEYIFFIISDYYISFFTYLSLLLRILGYIVQFILIDILVHLYIRDIYMYIVDIKCYLLNVPSMKCCR